MGTPRVTTAAFIGLCAGALLLTGCGATSLTSTYHEKPFVVDGDPADWVGLPMYVDKSGVNVAVSHDAEYLYVMVSTTDRAQQAQIRRGGFTVWFDPQGGSSHTFGVKYPVGMPGMPPPDMSESEDMTLPPGGMGRPEGRLSGRGAQTDMELLGPEDEDRMIVSLLQEKQIQAKINDASGGLSYELRVPLQHDAKHPHGIGVVAGKELGLALETQSREKMMSKSGGGPRGSREGGRGGRMPSGGDDQQGGGMMPPGGDGQGPGGGRGPGGMRGDRSSGSGSSPIDITLKVVLSK
jgi:hypothetical protein